MYTLRIASFIRKVLLRRVGSKEEQAEEYSGGEEALLSPIEDSEENAETDNLFWVPDTYLAQPEDDSGLGMLFDWSGTGLLLPPEIVDGITFAEQVIIGADGAVSEFLQQSFSETMQYMADGLERLGSLGEDVLSVASLDVLSLLEERTAVHLPDEQPFYGQQNHYAPLSEGNFRDGAAEREAFSDSSGLVAESRGDSYLNQVYLPESRDHTDFVGDFLRGERLGHDNDDYIHFYDGEPIRLGEPVVVDPSTGEIKSHLSEGGVGQNSSGAVNSGGPLAPSNGATPSTGDDNGSNGLLQNPGGKGLPIFEDEFGTDPVLKVDVATYRGCVTLDGTRLDDGDVVLIERFELGHDSLRIESVFPDETVLSLMDNNPEEYAGGHGEAILTFSVGVDRGEECTVAFVGMTYNEYMDFITQQMQIKGEA